MSFKFFVSLCFECFYQWLVILFLFNSFMTETNFPTFVLGVERDNLLGHSLPVFLLARQKEDQGIF